MSKKIEPKITCESKSYDRTAKEVVMIVEGAPDAVLQAAKNWNLAGKVQTFELISQTSVRVKFVGIRSPHAAGMLFMQFREEVAAVLAA